MNKLDPKAFGLALGILWGGSLIFMGLLAMTCSWAHPFVNGIGVKYIGYEISIVGALIGGLWGFIDAGLGGVLLAWLYNKFLKQ